MTRFPSLTALAWLGCASGECDLPGPGEPVLHPIELSAEVSVDSLGPVFPSLDGHCRSIAFSSAQQVLVHRLGTAQFELASVNSAGNPGWRPSGLPVLSGDARRLAFDSAARLVPGAQNRHDQIYVRDLHARSTLRVSISSQGALANDANLGLDSGLAVDDDGSVIAFRSYATNLVEDDRNRAADVFVHDLDTRATSRVSIASNGAEARGGSAYPSLSADGGLVAFSSDADDLVAGDRNGDRDVFLHDRATGRTERLSITLGGESADGDSDLPALSGDGRFVTFASDATNLVPADTNRARDVFLLDRTTGRVMRISESPHGEPADGASDFPVLSADGSRVGFVSRASNLVSHDGNGRQDVFVRDLRVGVTWLASRRGDVAADDDSGDWGLSLSRDGRCLAFASFARSLRDGSAPGPSLFVAWLP